MSPRSPSNGSQVNLNVAAATVWTGASLFGVGYRHAELDHYRCGGTYANGAAVEFLDGAGTGSAGVAGTVSPFSLSSTTPRRPTPFPRRQHSGSVTLAKEGAGSLAITMTGNTYNGGTALGGGVLQIGRQQHGRRRCALFRAVGHRPLDRQRRHLAGRRRR